MNFTREPIIETIVSPKDGYKLCIRNSKLPAAEEFFVDSVEVVSFGNSLFFRGQERPKPFLVPVSDYEVFEVKETRVVLKNIAHDRNIKIGGGREASLKPNNNRETPVEKKEETEEVREGELATTAPEGSSEAKGDRKRDRRRSRRRRLAEKRNQEKTQDGSSSEESAEDGDDDEDGEAGETGEAKAIPVFTHLLPPPPVLISERLSQLRSKEMAEGAISGVAVEGEIKDVAMEEVEPSQMHNATLDEEDEDFTF